MARPVTVLPLEYYPHWPERGEADLHRRAFSYLPPRGSETE